MATIFNARIDAELNAKKREYVCPCGSRELSVFSERFEQKPPHHRMAIRRYRCLGCGSIAVAACDVHPELSQAPVIPNL